MTNQFTHRDRLAILGFLLAGLIGLLTYIYLYDSAFPSASLNLKITRAEALRISSKFLSSQGYRLDGYQHTIVFDFDSTDKEYLERNLGLRRANQLMSDKIKVWYWHIRWFKPMQEEEFSTSVSPSGELVSYRHTIPEKAKGANLSTAKARRLAVGFLTGQGIDLAKYFATGQSDKKLPNRTNHFFQWEEKGFRAAKAKNRIHVSVNGDGVSSFGYSLKIPEDWDRKTSGESGKGDLLMMIANVFYTIISFAAPVVFLFAVRSREIRWRFTLVLVAILCIAGVTQSFNSLPLIWSSYDTTQTIGSFWAGRIVAMIAGIIMLALGIFLMASSADVMSRRALPNRVPISLLLTKRGLVSAEFIRASLIGFGLGLAQLGYVAAFYVVAMKYFHAWSPAAVPYSNILSTTLPWIYPLTIGLSAAIDEELTFRLFAISILKRYTKLTWLAVGLPAITWAFLHSNYPQVPAYVRGIEISVVGVVLGIVYLRYGIIATLVSHYTYNAVVSGTLLLQSDSLYFKTSGLAVMALMLLPLLPAAILRIRKGSFSDVLPEPEQPPLPPRPAPTPPVPEVEPPRVYVPLTRTKIITFTMTAVVAAAVCCALFWDQIEEATRPAKCINRVTAYQLAEKYLKQHGGSTKGFLHYAEFYDLMGDSDKTYVVRHMDRKKAEKLFEQLHDTGWSVSWFKPLSPEYYNVWMDEDGAFYSWEHGIKEDAPGPNLSAAKARPIADKWLASLGFDLSQYKLVDSSSSKYDHRTDHSFTWEKKTPKIAGASFRVSADVQGDTAMYRCDFIDVPDEYYREQRKTTTRMAVCQGILGIIGLLLSVALLVVFVLQFVAKRIKWKQAAAWGVLFVCITLVQQINDLPTFYSGYSDTDPLSRYIWTSILTTALTLLGTFASIVFLAGLADALYRKAFPGKQTVSDWFSPRSTDRWRIRALQDGIIIAVTSLPVMGLAGGTAEAIQRKYFPTLATASGSSFSEYMTSLSPAAAVIALILTMMISVSLSAALLAGLVRMCTKRTWTLLLVVVILAGLGIGADAKKWPEFWQAVIGLAAAIPVVYLLLRHWFGHNAYAYVFLIYFVGLQAEGMGLTNSADQALRANGIILICLAWIPVAVAVYAWWRDRRRKTPPTEATTYSPDVDSASAAIADQPAEGVDPCCDA